METKRHGALPWLAELDVLRAQRGASRGGLPRAEERTSWLLHLPRRAVLGGLDVARLARSRGDTRDPRELEHRFGLHRHEHRFVRALLERHAQLWVFRCDQRRACGDVVVIDMSARVDERAFVVVELKQRAVVRESPAHVQLAHHRVAHAELVARGVIAAGARVVALIGGVGAHDLLGSCRGAS